MVKQKAHCKLLSVCIDMVVKRQKTMSRRDTNSCKYIRVENILGAFNDQETPIILHHSIDTSTQ